MKRLNRAAAALLAASLVLTACGGDSGPVTVPGGDNGGNDNAGDNGDGDNGGDTEDLPAGSLVGAGATFVNPIFVDWIFDYEGTRNPGADINYQSIGSGGGIEQFMLQTVDFGASERYLRDDTLAEARENRGCDAIQFPIVFGSVTIAFNDPQFDGLVLSGTVIGDIFERRITRYNDPAIVELNPDRDLPDLEIVPVHRSDGSGTTSVFTTYLDKDPGVEGWTLGNGTEVQWPSGLLAGQGNEGVAAVIDQEPGALGYLNQAYVLENDLPQAAVLNAAGNAVFATLEATTAAADVADIPENFQFDILDIGGDGFPIAGTAWVLAWECGYDEATGALMRDFWSWAISDEGAALASALNYAPIGSELRPRIQAAIDRINIEG